MTPLNLLRNSYLIFGILLLGSQPSQAYPFENHDAKKGSSLSNEPVCEEIEAEIQITHTSENRANGEISVVFTKTDGGPYTLFVFSGLDSRDNKLEIKDTKVTELKKGEYNLYIQNKEGCTKHIKAKIN